MLATEIKNIFDENLTEILSKPNEERLSHFESLVDNHKNYLFNNSEGYWVLMGLKDNSIAIPNSFSREEIMNIFSVTNYIIDKIK